MPDSAPSSSGRRLRGLLRRPRRCDPRLAPIDRIIVLATLVAIVVVGSGTVAVILRSAPSEAVIDAPALLPGDVVPPPTTSSVPPTTVATTPAPQPASAPRTTPIPPPADPRAKEPIVKIGEIRIPKIGLVHPVYEGVTLTVIDQGPGHWPGSAMPGQLGNAVFAGHRVTKTRPFRNVDQLVPGDEIILTTDAGTFTYRMTRQEIVLPKDVWIVNPTPDATVTLFACHPPGSARQRIVIRGVLSTTDRT